MALMYLFAFVAALVLIKIYIKLSSGRYKITKNLNGVVVLITGATSGIGKETALALAKAGASVHLLCRNTTKGDEIAEEITNKSNNATLFVHHVDLTRFDSIRKFAKDFLSTPIQIHVLINNAGMMANKQTLTEDGFEETIQANHLGHFLLTSLLLERIKSSAPSRIVNVASMLHLLATSFDVHDLNFQTSSYSFFNAYACSKLCNILFTTELARRLQGSGITVNCLHPGAIQSNLFQHQPYYRWPIIGIFYPFFKTTVEGCQTMLYLAISDEVKTVSGYYFADCKPEKTSLKAMDFQIAEDLWKESAKLTKVKD